MTDATERRRSPRLPPARTELRSARIVGGTFVRVRDLSRHGLAVSGRQRAAPGRTVALMWTMGDLPIRLGARVVRTRVCGLHGEAGVEYLMGLEFTAPADTLWELATQAG